MECEPHEFENMSPDIPSDNQSNQNIYCFVCRQINSEEPYDLEYYSFRFICQYLKVPWKSLGPSSNGKETTDCLSSVPDFPVSLCFTCASVSTKLVALIQQLEVTQLFINHQIQKLYECFKAPSATHQTSDTNKRSFCEENETSANIYHGILANKCSEEVTRIQSTYPKVIVEPVVIKKQTFPDYSDDKSESSNDNYEPMEQSPDDYSEKEDSEETPAIPETPIVPDLPENHPSIHMFQVSMNYFQQMSDPATQPECATCRSSYILHDRGKFVSHFAARHTEKVFEHQRLPHITSQQFKTCCKHALDLHISRAKRIKDGNYRIICPVCSSKYKDAEKLRVHVVTKHYEKIEQKIICLQKSENIDKLSKVELPGIRKEFSRSKCENWERLKRDCKTLFKRVSTFGKFKCSLCGYLAPVCNPQGHLVNDHPTTLFQSCKPSNLSVEAFHELCANIMENEVDKSKPLDDQKKSRAFQCHLCSLKLYTRTNVRYHLASKHYKVLEEIFMNAADHKNETVESTMTAMVGFTRRKIRKRLQKGQARKMKNDNNMLAENIKTEDDNNEKFQQANVAIKQEAEADIKIFENSDQF